jgi:hypothetical protein
MEFINIYSKEARYLRWYIAFAISGIILSYSVYLLFEAETVANLGREDRFFEWLTALCFLSVSIIFLLLYARVRNIIFLILTAVFFFGFGEEISWGQRLLGFGTPESLQVRNVQNEFNIHNIELLNRVTMEGEPKTGLSRLLEVNLLFKIFTIVVAVLLPLFVFHSRFVSGLTRSLRFPVPPVSITIFFILNWLVFKVLIELILPEGHVFQYYDTNTEIFEFVSAFIILVVSVYFYNQREIEPGKDIKHAIIEKAV